MGLLAAEDYIKSAERESIRNAPTFLKSNHPSDATSKQVGLILHGPDTLPLPLVGVRTVL